MLLTLLQSALTYVFLIGPAAGLHGGVKVGLTGSPSAPGGPLSPKSPGKPCRNVERTLDC